VDPFFEPKVTDLWESTTELVGDASLARQVIEHLAVGFWNMEWKHWEALARIAVVKSHDSGSST
jgi:hypothetical protein